MNKFFYKLKMSGLGNFLSSIRSLHREYFTNYRKKMGYCDPTATVTKPLIIKGPQNVFLYEGTKIVDANISTPVCKFVMRRYSGSAEGLKVITGSHERKLGRYYRTVKQSEKSAGFDEDVIVEEDCWIGVNVTLLMGVIIRRGTTVAAGAVVTKSTAPYSIVGGIPAKHIKFYWTIDQILEHEKQLYPEEERYSREELERFFAQYSR